MTHEEFVALIVLGGLAVPVVALVALLFADVTLMRSPDDTGE